MQKHLLKQFRIQSGLEVKQVAEMWGVYPMHYAQIEMNPEMNCKKKTMESVAAVFDLPPALLFFPEDEILSLRLIRQCMVYCCSVLEKEGKLSKKDFETFVKTVYDLERGQSSFVASHSQ